MVRHAPTEKNAIEPGWSQAPIDPKRGERIAQRAAAELAKRQIQLVIGSDLQRSLDTMEIIARPRRLPVFSTEVLRAWNVGDELEGRRREEIEPELLFFRENPHLTPRGGESFGAFCASRQEAIRNLISAAAAPPYPRMAVVMHASVLLLVRPTIEGHTPDPKKKEPPPPGRILTIVVTPKGVECDGL